MFIQPLFSLWSIYITFLYHTIFPIPIPLYNFLLKNPFDQLCAPTSITIYFFPWTIENTLSFTPLSLLLPYLLLYPSNPSTYSLITYSLSNHSHSHKISSHILFIFFPKMFTFKNFFISLLTKQYYYKNDTYVDNIFQWRT